ncbi:MAG: DUF1080 domain-containing protein [Armatimonadota bacterium]|nr:DUF1080 domain-containing protein [Armatimonadota bacterium]
MSCGLMCAMAVFGAIGVICAVPALGSERQIVKLSEVQMMLRPQGALIITSDEEMRTLEAGPNFKVKAFDGRLEDIAKGLEGYDGALINVAYDFFFGLNKRELFPTSPQCVRTFKALHDTARKHGVGFGASVLSPLDLGPAYYREKGRGGQTHQFQEGELKPDGSYSIPLRAQRQWFHNKGPVKLRINSVRAFAFSEEKIGNTSYYAVDPSGILDISESARIAVDETTEAKGPGGYITVQGVVSGLATSAGKRNRVLAIVVYDVEEMDYFSPDVLPFLTGMLDAHKAAGIAYDSFYSDEMHIQFDWDLGGAHFGPTEINTRYITPGLVTEYARLHGEKYQDFEKYLVYFAFAQHGFLGGEGEPEMAQHVFGPKAEDIYATWKFRRDYYRLLTDTVVDLFIRAKKHGEKIFDRKRIWTRAHATWQESPTCDHVDAAWKPAGAPLSRYDYTPAYEWSSSIRENVSACYDYFRWGDFLTGMGNDHPEGGYIDRNYNGAALGASFGIFNDVPYGYWAHWGAPSPVSQRVQDVAAAYGLAGQMWNCGYPQDWEHRKTPVLALYPLDLNSVEERYGSWMVQYGYCDYLTEEKFAELAKPLPNGRFKVKDREYTTLVALYEPMIQRKTMTKLCKIAECGGNIIWTGLPPAIYTDTGKSALSDWRKLFGIASVQDPWNGLNAENASVTFAGALKSVPSFRVPTHLLVDRVYPAQPSGEGEASGAVVVDGRSLTIATALRTDKGGRLVYFGGRPRDDQSGSTPDAPRTLFNLLRAIGAYSADGPGWAELASNTGDLLVCEFPNGAVSVARHYYKVQEDWGGGFFRPEGEKFDESGLPPSRLDISERGLGPYRVNYTGERCVTFRVSKGALVGFAGALTQGMEINQRKYRFADVPVNITFAPLPEKQLGNGIRQAWFLNVSHAGGSGELVVRLPFETPDGLQWVADPKQNGRGTPTSAAAIHRPGETELRVPPEMQGVTLYVFAEDNERSRPFTSLFNAKDLSGWRVMGGQAWSAQDGILVCSGEGRGWLRSEGEYQDFVLRLEYRVPKGGNSGVFVRAAEEGDPSYTGFQLQIYDDYGRALDDKSSGAVVGAIAPSANTSKPAGEWNRMEISCIGSILTVRHNGRRVVRVNIEDPELNARLKDIDKLNKRRRSGYVGLQNHGMTVEFRGIEIRRI